MEEIKQWVLAGMQKKFPDDTFYWQTCKKGYMLCGTKNVKREDYAGWPEDTWFDFMARMKDIACLYITKELIDDLKQYNGIVVEDEMLKSAVFDFERFRIY